MKNLLLVFAILFCLQLGANAQSQKAVDGEAPIPLTKSETKKSEVQIIAQNIKKDINNRTTILANTNELKAALYATFGKDVNIIDVNVVAHIMKISNDENQARSIRREALKVLHSNIPAGHILETQTTK